MKPQDFSSKVGTEEILAAGLFDQYIDDGHSVEELMMEINSLFAASVFFNKGQGNKA